jgi:hypothetical protein
MRRISFCWLAAALLAMGCAPEAILGPSDPAIALTRANLAGRWTEFARIYQKVGLLSGVTGDTVAVAPADATILEFGVPDSNYIRRIQPDPGQSILDVFSNDLHWSIGTSSGYAAQLTPTRMTLSDGHSEAHRFPGDQMATSAEVQYVFRRSEEP